MHDIRLIRENPEAFDAAMAPSRARPAAQAILSADADRRDLLTRMQEAQARRNEASKAIGAAMGKGDKDTAEALKAEVASLKDALPAMEEDERRLTGELNAVLAALPNRPADDVPAGEDESANVEVLRWGTPREFAFTRANMPTSARRWVSISKPVPSSRARASRSCADRWPASTARSRSSCWISRPAPTAIPNARPR
jgi:seryl-tRNA synthetase